MSSHPHTTPAGNINSLGKPTETGHTLGVTETFKELETSIEKLLTLGLEALFPAYVKSTIS